MKKTDTRQLNFLFESKLTPPQSLAPNTGLGWIMVAKNNPYFITEDRNTWTPIGQNDGITWPDLAGAFKRKDLAQVEHYLRYIADHGVNCLRLMLEYCQTEHRYLERPVGHFQPRMVQLWDDLFALFIKIGLRVILTPFDTYWMWRRWAHHPYNVAKGGICHRRSQWLVCPQTRQAIKNRLLFATQRWGGTGAIFAWDIWNEIRPAHGGNSTRHFDDFISDVGGFLRQAEIQLHGRAHLQTVSAFSPVLQKDPSIASSTYNHSGLDFATIHLYEKNTIDNPRNTVAPAIATGKLVQEALQQITDQRPFFDSEHGPIYRFINRKQTLPEAFDDEYFRLMQWAHLASGGAGGGMRWPYRFPHSLTHGMRLQQLSLSKFVALVQFNPFKRINISSEVALSDVGLMVFACGDHRQSILYLVRKDTVGSNKMLQPAASARPVRVDVPGLQPGQYTITAWDTRGACIAYTTTVHHCTNDSCSFDIIPVYTEIVLLISAQTH